MKGTNYCYDCNGIKENINQSYCLKCSRIKWLLRCKPDCATCGKEKENKKDSYCNECKRTKKRAQSKLAGKRLESPKGMGRSIFCSKCKGQKTGSYLKESYCGPCKISERKKRYPSRNEEQIFKESVRKITWKKIHDGELIKLPCEICGNIKVEAHHDDYYRPLDVRWLCRKHHREHHLKQKEDK